MQYVQFIVTLILILVIFFVADSYKKNQDKKLKEMQSKIKVGDKVITYSGLSGTVCKDETDSVVVKINPSQVEMSIQRWAIAGIDDIQV